MTRQLPLLAFSLLLVTGTVSLPVSAAEHENSDPEMTEMEGDTDTKQGEKGSPPGQKDKEWMSDRDDIDRERKKDMERDRDKKKEGYEKQRERKMEQEQKELGKGSEQGEESREERRKWWRFWE